jgi:hypothetical protein
MPFSRNPNHEPPTTSTTTIMTSLVVARNESNRATNSNNNNSSKQHTHETNYFGGRTGCMIQRLSAAAEQHPISRIVRKCHSTSTHALGHFSAAVEPIAAAQSIIRRQGQYYCCWRQLIRAVDIHIQWKFNQCEACQRYNLAGGPEYTTTTRDSQANQSKNSINDIVGK